MSIAPAVTRLSADGVRHASGVPLLTHRLSTDLSSGLLTFSVDDLADSDHTGPAHGVINEPGEARDFVTLGYPYPIGISDNAQDAFAHAGLKGWTTRTLVLDGWHTPCYAALLVTGRCGPLDWSRSTAEKQIGQWTRYRGLFPQHRENVEDFCLPDRYTHILITERAAACIREEQLTGCECVPLSEATGIR